MNTYYIFANLYGGHVTLLAEAAREHGAELLAVNCLAFEEIPPGERGFREGNGAYLFRLQGESVRAAINKVQQNIILLAGERFTALEDEEPPTQDGPGWDEEDLAKIRVAEQVAKEGYYSRYGYDE